jgi:hypothetical protein
MNFILKASSKNEGAQIHLYIQQFGIQKHKQRGAPNNFNIHGTIFKLQPLTRL